MPESTLSLTFSELESETGDYLGFGRGTNGSDTAWSTRQQSDITSCVRSGIRMFYFPMPLPGDVAAYDWSFMRPTRQILLPDGASSVDLPDDFGGLEGDVRVIESGRYTTGLKQTNESFIASLHSSAPDVTGYPMWCAVRQNSLTTQTKGQRASLYLYPAADEEYTLELQYYILPDALSTSFPYALGGATHAETLKAACKAAAELYKDNERGPMWAIFIDRMRASVSLDRRNKAQTSGYNSDPGYNRTRHNWYRGRNFDRTITFNGSDPG